MVDMPWSNVEPGGVSNTEQNSVESENMITVDKHRRSRRIQRNTRKRTHVSPHSGSCISVVDDEIVIASSLAAILQMKGFSAKFFTCPLAALAAARSESPELVIFGRRDAGYFWG